MQALAEGFRIEGQRVAWGTTLGDLARLLALRPGETLIPCRLAYGLPTLSATPNGPGIDRPVLGVAYDLADVQALRPDDWVGAVSELLGPPGEVKRYGLSDGGRPKDAVILNARWEAVDVGVSLSIFGAPRPTSLGPSIGTLWISWRDDLAAMPYLAGWRERSAQLAASLRGVTDIRTYALAWPGHPIHGSSERGPETASMRDRRHRHLCLHHPHLLATPDEVARRLSAGSFAIWSNEAEQIWCASTPWETLAKPYGTKLAIDWIEMLPAKGAGFSAIEIGRWRVVSSQGSVEIAEAVRHLERFSGVRIVRHEGHDC